jgi:hypothetical protein
MSSPRLLKFACNQFPDKKTKQHHDYFIENIEILNYINDFIFTFKDLPSGRL